jgi:hypothetical protein
MTIKKNPKRPGSGSPRNPYDEMIWRTYEEQLRQARWIFNLSCLAIAIAILTTLSAGSLMLSGQATQASINAVMGLISTGLYVPLMRASTSKLKELKSLTKDFKELPPAKA